MRQSSYDGSPSLYLIPTPIGNMEDITLRSIKVLQEVDFLLCEDTRVTHELLNKLDISKKCISCHDHNEDSVKKMVVENLVQGKNIGLVTDRGTPIISDPGFKVVQEVIKNGFNVIPLPGACAFVPALIASGIDPEPFTFYGFLNSKVTKREKELEKLKDYPYTIIFYEAPHRLKDMLESLLKIFGDRNISVNREISKLFEEIIRGKISDIIYIADTLKGEFVVVVEGNKDTYDYGDLSIKEHVDLYVNDGMKPNDAIKKVAVERNIAKSIVYNEYHIGR